MEIEDVEITQRDGHDLPLPSERQYCLRRILKANWSHWLKGKEIFTKMQETLYPYDGSPELAYKQINEDVKFLNLCGRFDKMIIGNRSRGYKMATQEEFATWFANRASEYNAAWDYAKAMADNAKMDGQVILNLWHQKDLREFHDCFVPKKANP